MGSDLSDRLDPDPKNIRAPWIPEPELILALYQRRCHPPMATADARAVDLRAQGAPTVPNLETVFDCFDHTMPSGNVERLPILQLNGLLVAVASWVLLLPAAEP